MFEKLNELRKLLIEHRDNGVQFNLFRWKTTMGCNTICCAVGLHMYHKPDCGLVVDEWTSELRFEGLRSYKAAAKFYGITESEALFLFSPRHYHVHDDPMLVVARIDWFLKIKGGAWDMLAAFEGT